jgi:hypothetical protein
MPATGVVHLGWPSFSKAETLVPLHELLDPVCTTISGRPSPSMSPIAGVLARATATSIS